MLRLLVNDFRLNAVFVFWAFFLFNVHLVLMAALGLLGKYAVVGVQSAATVIASAMVVAVFLREEQNKGQILIRSLPISHGKVVCARYLSICLLVIGSMLYGIFYWAVVGSSIHNTYLALHFRFLLEDPSSTIAHSLIARALAISTAVAIAVPLIVRYGTFWRILIMYAVLMIAWSAAIVHLVSWSSVAADFFGSPTAWLLVSVVFIITILAASIRLSTWLYGRKDL
jgi:hypothetical protein